MIFLKYTLETIICVIQATTAFVFVCPFKKKTKNYICFYISTMLLYFSLSVLSTTDIFAARLTALMEEALIIPILITIFIYGNMWRNWFVAIVAAQICSVIYYIVAEFLLPPGNAMALLLRHRQGEASIAQFLIALGITLAIETPIILVMRKVVKKEYYGSGKIYKVIILCIYIITVASYSRYMDGLSQSLGENYENLINLFFLLHRILLLVVGIAIYNMVMKRRIKREIGLLNQSLEQIHTHYERVAKEIACGAEIRKQLGKYADLISSAKQQNACLSSYEEQLDEMVKSFSYIPLTGYLEADVLLADFHDRCKAADILFTLNYEPCLDLKNQCYMLAYLEHVLKWAFSECGKSDGKRWISLDFRNHGGVYIQLECCKNEAEQYYYENKRNIIGKRDLRNEKKAA